MGSKEIRHTCTSFFFSVALSGTLLQSCVLGKAMYHATLCLREIIKWYIALSLLEGRHICFGSDAKELEMSARLNCNLLTWRAGDLVQREGTHCLRKCSCRVTDYARSSELNLQHRQFPRTCTKEY